MSTKSGPEWAERQKRVNRIVGRLSEELGGENVAPSDFMEDVWLALQVIYGPSWAAELMRRYQSS